MKQGRQFRLTSRPPSSEERSQLGLDNPTSKNRASRSRQPADQAGDSQPVGVAEMRMNVVGLRTGGAMCEQDGDKPMESPEDGQNRQGPTSGSRAICWP